ncbi:MAG: isoprenylcysteine carboxylmethyltransferase family protein [Bacteroidales bacterium]|nr:isoprenylcysteine carboxylmethyltransferase family protein [Bacteroidales bacterium]
MTADQLLILLAGTIMIILFSWFVSIRERRYHGIPRFFAFEGLLVFALLNSSVWFKDPLSIPQIVAWLLFIFSIYYAFTAFRLFHRHGKPGRNFENTTQLVTTGLYHYVRHPMYGSLLFLGWGMFLKSMTWQTIVLIVIISVALYITCKVEEKEMLKKFGDEYETYLTKTKMFIPYIY